MYSLLQITYNLSADVTIFRETSKLFNSTIRLKLRKLCWETMYGQELVKLIIMDTVSYSIALCRKHSLVDLRKEWKKDMMDEVRGRKKGGGKEKMRKASGW